MNPLVSKILIILTLFQRQKVFVSDILDHIFLRFWDKYRREIWQT